MPATRAETYGDRRFLALTDSSRLRVTSSAHLVIIIVGFRDPIDPIISFVVTPILEKIFHHQSCRVLSYIVLTVNMKANSGS